MSIRLKIRDGKILGYAAAGRQQPDYKTIFPDKVAKGIDELLDDYGNGQYEIRVSETEDGKQAEVVKHRQVPSEAQISRQKKQLFKEKYSYDRDDEIAIIKDSLNAIANGKEPPKEYTDMEAARAQVKQEVHDEIEEDLKTIRER